MYGLGRMIGRFGIAVAAVVLTQAAGADPAERDEASDAKVLLATTTSVRDSGLLDTLVPVFEERTGIAVQVVAVGTGAALRMGAEGNADVLLTHAPEAEQEIVATGALVDRRPFMENYFVIAGPAADPAQVASAGSPEDALRGIAGSGAPFVSRADDSGTHKREVALFESAGLDPAETWEGFTRTGTGMGLTLQVAGERRAYVLSDLGTFLAFQARTGLVALSTPAPSLRNVYSVLRVDPERFAGRVHGAQAQRFADFLLEAETQRVIGEFGRERFGRPLFTPLSVASPAP
jgi:tungstate transport system substrate-binding protein